MDGSSVELVVCSCSSHHSFSSIPSEPHHTVSAGSRTQVLYSEFSVDLNVLLSNQRLVFLLLRSQQSRSRRSSAFILLDQASQLNKKLLSGNWDVEVQFDLTPTLQTYVASTISSLSLSSAVVMNNVIFHLKQLSADLFPLLDYWSTSRFRARKSSFLIPLLWTHLLLQPILLNLNIYTQSLCVYSEFNNKT